MTIYSETMDKAEWSFQNIFHSPLRNGGSRKETDMREKAGVQELAAHDRKKYPLPRLSRTQKLSNYNRYNLGIICREHVIVGVVKLKFKL